MPGAKQNNEPRRPFEKYLGYGAGFTVLYGCVLVLHPFLTALLWGGVMVFTTWPLFERLNAFLGGRRTVAAAIMTALAAAIFVLPFTIVGISLAENIDTAKEMISALMAMRTPQCPEWLSGLPVVGPRVAEFWLDFLGDTRALLDQLKQFAISSYPWFFKRLLDLGGGILQLTLSVFASFFLYRDGAWIARAIDEGVRKIAGSHAERVLTAVGGTVMGVVHGILGTALAQGALTAIGLLMAGVPSALFLGLLAFFFSPLPIGAPAIWIPASIWLFYHGHIGWGVFLLLWGTLVVSSIDNFLKPYLISRSSDMSFLLIFLGIVGGVLCFGFIGIFLGPTLLAVGLTLVYEFCGQNSNKEHGSESIAGAQEFKTKTPE